MNLSSQCTFIDIHTHTVPKGAQKAYCGIYNLDLRSEISPECSFYSVGIHPWWLDEMTDEQVNRIARKMRSFLSDQRMVAMGECGLDRLRGGDIKRQERVFRLQLEMASNCHLPVIIHTVKSDDLCLNILRDYSALSFCVHGFNRKPAAMEAYLNLGGFISFGRGIINNQSARESIKAVQEDAFLLETDGSDLPIEEIYQSAAEARGLSLHELQQKIKLNYDAWTRGK